MIEISQAETAEQIKDAKTLLAEYANALNFDLCFQSFDTELANLPGDYAPPLGCLLLAYIKDEPAGCIAVRAWFDDIVSGNINTGERGASAVQREQSARTEPLA